MSSTQEEGGGGVRSGPGAARTILLSHIISARPSKQPLMVRTFLKVYMELGSYCRRGHCLPAGPWLRAAAVAADAGVTSVCGITRRHGALQHYHTMTVSVLGHAWTCCLNCFCCPRPTGKGAVKNAREPALRNTYHGPRTSLPQLAFHPTDHVQQDIHPTDNPPQLAQKSWAGEARH